MFYRFAKIVMPVLIAAALQETAVASGNLSGLFDGAYDQSPMAKFYFLSEIRNALDANGKCVSCADVGYKYMAGDGCKRDYDEGRKWILRGAAAGEPYSYVCLGAMYREGLGVKRDLTESYKWFYLASKYVDADYGKNALVGVSRLIKEPQKVEGRRRAADWLKNHPVRVSE